MVDKIKEILRLCEEKWPTDGARHNFAYDAIKDELLLTIFYKDMWYTFNPEYDDLDDPTLVIEEMSKWLT